MVPHMAIFFGFLAKVYHEITLWFLLSLLRLWRVTNKRREERRKCVMHYFTDLLRMFTYCGLLLYYINNATSLINIYTIM